MSADTPQKAPVSSHQWEDYEKCGTVMIVGTGNCSCCGWNPLPAVTSASPSAKSPSTTKRKREHSAEWAKNFVEARKEHGAAYDEELHKIYCEPCRAMYLPQAKAAAETKESRGQVDRGMYAFALGIPDGPKWEDDIYSHFKEQRRVAHATIPNRFIIKGAPDSHMKALHAWNGRDKEKVQHEVRQAWSNAEAQAAQSLVSREITARIMLEQLYFLGTETTAIWKLPRLVEHIHRTVTLIEQTIGAASIPDSVSSFIPPKMEKWTNSIKIRDALRALTDEVLRVGHQDAVSSLYTNVHVGCRLGQSEPEGEGFPMGPCVGPIFDTPSEHLLRQCSSVAHGCRD